MSEHLDTESIEQEIITIADSYQSIKHDFDDCGTLAMPAMGVKTMIFDIDDPRFTVENHSTDAFLTMHVSRERSDYQGFFKQLDSYLSRNGTHIRKADTTFIWGRPYATLTMADGKNLSPDKNTDFIGSVDAVVLGRHFREVSESSGFYSACAAISDIGANGGLPYYIHIHLINPKDDDAFLKGAYSAARFCNIDSIGSSESERDDDEFSAVLTVLGKVPSGRQMTLRGLEEGMRIYITGRCGISAATDYRTPQWHLEHNLDPSSRKAVFDSIRHPALGSDVSDGVDKSCRNFLRYAPHLDIIINDNNLLTTGENDSGIPVTLDHIKYGGDDYSIVIATRQRPLGCVEVGSVIKGNGNLNHL